MANKGYFACRFGKKKIKNATQEEFSTPAGAKKVKFWRAAAVIQTMTNPRVFPGVEVLLAVLQLLTTIAVVEDLIWLKTYGWLK